MSLNTDFMEARARIISQATSALLADIADPLIKYSLATSDSLDSSDRQIADIMLPMSVASALVNAGLLSGWLALQVLKEGTILGLKAGQIAYEAIKVEAVAGLKTAEKIAVDVLVDAVNVTNIVYHTADSIAHDVIDYAKSSTARIGALLGLCESEPNLTMEATVNNTSEFESSLNETLAEREDVTYSSSLRR